MIVIQRQFSSREKSSGICRRVRSGLIGPVAGGYSLVTGDNMVVVAVWGVVGPIVGAMTSHFFGPLRIDTG
jgi:hypothetical protein